MFEIDTTKLPKDVRIFESSYLACTLKIIYEQDDLYCMCCQTGGILNEPRTFLKTRSQLRLKQFTVLPLLSPFARYVMARRAVLVLLDIAVDRDATAGLD